MAGKGLTKTHFIAGIPNVHIDRTGFMQKQTIYPNERGMVVVRDAPPVMSVMTLAVDFCLLQNIDKTLMAAGIESTHVKNPVGEAFLSIVFMQDKFSGYESTTN